MNYNEEFLLIWPTEISDDVRLFNAIIGKENLKWKDNQKKLIRELTTAEFITFNDMLISASDYSCQGDKLWNTSNKVNERKKRRLSDSTLYFSRHMKIWSLKKTKQFIPDIC